MNMNSNTQEISGTISITFSLSIPELKSNPISPTQNPSKKEEDEEVKETKEEVFKTLVYNGEETNYEISNYGSINKIKSNGEVIPLKLSDKNGYKSTTLTLDKGKYKQLYVHRLVGMNFLVTDDGLPVINHLDGNKHNNYVGNIEWTTPKGNSRHAIETGLHKVEGEDNANAKLSKEEVIFIRDSYKRKEFTQRQLAEIFNMSPQIINYIVNFKRWKSVK